MSNAPAPFVLSPILKPKVWGGRRLARFAKALPPEGGPDAMIGESWELADLDSTSAGGGGGEAAHSTIATGAMAGHTIRDAVRAWGGDLLGDASPTASGGFPLLVKYLDAREHLSVQVHPSPAYAAAHADAHLKTESWYVLAAEASVLADGTPIEPVLYKGVREGVTPDVFASLVAEGRAGEAMVAEPAVPGTCHTLPSGTLHALGAGVLVAEVQTPSDTTFRVYDWQREYARPDRELHLERAMRCIEWGAAPGGLSARAEDARGVVAATPFYELCELRGHCEEKALAPIAAGRCAVLMLVGGMGGELASASGAFQGASMGVGATAVIPASCASDTVLRAGPGTVALVAMLGDSTRAPAAAG
ncbi:MAG: type I phosphomannose isomerase catalytic subunit [Planctomycetota bacterium]